MSLKITTLLLLVTFSTFAQKVKVPVDTTSTSTHSVTIKGKTIPYKAELGFQPVWDESGNPVATLNYTYYSRTDIKDDQTRPLDNKL